MKSYYAVIPANVRYCNDLPANAKLLFGEITALSNETGYCWASNSYFADLYNVASETISRWVSLLAKHEFIRVEVIESEGNQRRIYLRHGMPPIDKKIKRGIDEKIKRSCSKDQDPIDEKIKHNNTVNITNNSYVANIENPIDLLLTNFPEVPFTPAQLGHIASSITTDARDREAWAATVEHYFYNYDPMRKQYMPQKVSNMLSLFRDKRAKLPDVSELKVKPEWYDTLKEQEEIMRPVYVG